MIFDFIKGLSPILVNELRSEYERFLNELEFIAKINKNLAKWIEKNYELITFLLELSVFYRRIMIPLKGVAEFGARVPYSLIIGSEVLNKDKLKNINRVVKIFERILSKYNITPWLLDFGDIEEFLYKLIRFEKEIDEQTKL